MTLISTTFILIYFSVTVSGGYTTSSGEVNLFSTDFTNVLAPDFIQCSRNLELNFKIDNQLEPKKVVDYHRCETFDTIQACKCDFLNRLINSCPIEDENLWFVENQRDYSCSSATELVFEVEDQIQRYLNLKEVEIQRQEIENREKEMKFVDINARSELNLEAKHLDPGEDELEWNSYSGENNRGPELGISEPVPVGWVYAVEDDKNTVLDKRGLPHISELNRKKLEKEARKHESEKQKIHFQQIERKLPLPKGNTVDHVVSSSSTFKVLTVVESSVTTVSTITSTGTMRVLQTASAVENAYPSGEFDSTTTVLEVLNKTQTVVQIVMAEIIEQETELQVAMRSVDIAATSNSQQLVTETESATSVSHESVTKTRVRALTQETSSTVQEHRTSRTRNGTYHQKLLAKANLRISKREQVNTSGLTSRLAVFPLVSLLFLLVYLMV